MQGQPTRLRWWSQAGIRLRATVVAVVALAIAIVFGAGALVVFLDMRLTASATEAVTIRVQDLASQVSSQDAAGIEAFALSTPGDNTVIQVLDSNASVLISSSSIEGEPGIVSPSSQPGPVTVTARALPFVDGIEYAVASQGVNRSGATLTVVAAQSLAPVQQSVSAVVAALAIGAPLLLVGVGAVTWIAVGQSLDSVRRIRSRVEEIDEYGLGERVPVPASRDEIGNLARTMNHLLDRMQGAMTQQRQFVADASHELKTPLATMRTTLDVGQSTHQSLDEVVPILDSSLDRMTSLVEDLLTLARAEGARSATTFEDVDLDDVLAEVASSFASKEASATVTLITEPVRVQGNRRLLLRAVRNLVENATTYGSTARISLSEMNGSAVVSVDDDGPGIPAKDRERAFGRFVRLDEHRSRSEGGTGLGLAIVAEVVALHGGLVRIDDSEMGGARVQILLASAHVPETADSSR